MGDPGSATADLDWNPRHLIRAANTLLPLGKPKVLAVLKEYSRVTGITTFGQPYLPTRDSVILALAATLFPAAPPPGQDENEADFDTSWKAGWPLLVSVHRRSAPWIAPNGLGAYAQSRLRSAAIEPPGDPVAAYVTLEIALRAEGVHGEHLRRYRNQFLRLIEPAYVVPERWKLEWGLPTEQLDRRWEGIQRELQGKTFRWNPSASRYVNGRQART